jgi:hypothetical protein
MVRRARQLARAEFRFTSNRNNSNTKYISNKCSIITSNNRYSNNKYNISSIFNNKYSIIISNSNYSRCNIIFSNR